MLRSILSWLNPFAASVAQTAPEVQAAIDKILHDANTKVVALKAQHGASALKDQAAADVAAVQAHAAKYIALIQAKLAIDLQAASATPVTAGPVGSTGAVTGPGPTGSTGTV